MVKKKRIEIVFKKTGYYYIRHYTKKLRVLREETSKIGKKTLLANETLLKSIGRETLLAIALEKYIMKRKFLHSNKRLLRRKLTLSEYKLLMGMLKIGSSNWWFWERALNLKWSIKELEGKILWRIL